MFNHLNEGANPQLNHENSTKTDYFLISKEYTIENSTSFYGCFNIGPFETGEGLTVSNSLRRTLLTCVGGLAITAVEIEGVSHEYSSIPGLKETVLDLLLSMNDIVFTTQNSKISSRTRSSKRKGNSNDAERNLLSGANVRGPSYSHPWPSQIGYLKKTGPGIIYARDLRLPPGICCVNPNHIIGTLSDTGHINMKFEMQFGKKWKETNDPTQLGYEKKSFCKSEQSITTTIPEENTFLTNQILLNPVFNPIKKVNYTIESFNNSSFFTTGLLQQILIGQPEGRSFPEKAATSNHRDYQLPSVRGGRTLANIGSALGKHAPSGSEALTPLGDKDQEDSSLISLYSNKTENYTTKNQLELIVLEIWTDGSIHPRDALSIALRKCVTTFSRLGEIPRL